MLWRHHRAGGKRGSVGAEFALTALAPDEVPLNFLNLRLGRRPGRRASSFVGHQQACSAPCEAFWHPTR